MHTWFKQKRSIRNTASLYVLHAGCSQAYTFFWIVFNTGVMRIRESSSQIQNSKVPPGQLLSKLLFSQQQQKMVPNGSISYSSSLSCSPMIQEIPWTTVGLQPESLATKNVGVMVERNSAILERFLTKVVQARDGDDAFLSPAVRQQLRNYVCLTASLYNAVHFHSFEHASHVLMSASSLVNELLRANHTVAVNQKNTEERQRNAWTHFTTYGISSNPMVQFAFVFAALVHDVQHEGITNRQLVNEGHPLAIRYHDRSVLEQNSLSVSYQLLFQSDFEDLRGAIFTTPDERQSFRSLLIDLLMTTDIGSPEQTEISKSKWKMAFTVNPEELHKERKRKYYEICPRRHSCAGSSPILEQSFTTNATTTQPPVNHIHIIKDNEEDTPEHIKKRKCHHSTEAKVLAPIIVKQNRESPVFRRRHSCLASIPFLTSLLPSPDSAVNNVATSTQQLSLGVQRTVDYNGRVTETFPQGDEYKANAILMYLMQVSDVAHTMQDFGTFLKWNRRLFDELRASFLAGRGVDCSANWYADQIRFLDSYIIPLAQRVKDCGALGQFGFELVHNAIQNRIRWTVEGKLHSRRFREEAV